MGSFLKRIQSSDYGACLLLFVLLSSSGNAIEMNFDSAEKQGSGAKTFEFSENTEVSGTGDEGGFSFPFSGEFTMTGAYFVEESPKERDRDGYVYGHLKLNQTGQLTETIQYVIQPKAYFHTGDRVSSELEFLEDSAERPIATFEEAYLSWVTGRYEFQIGKQIKSWGVGDAIKPNDVINPNDYLSVPDNFKIGVPAISGYRYGETINLNVVLVPFFTPARLPGLENRWSSDTTQSSADFQDAFGILPIYVDDGDIQPTNSFKNMQGGLNLSSSSLIRGWDLGLYFYRGFRSTGIINQRIAPPELGIQVSYPEFSQYGGSFSTTWKRFEIHGEFAYQDTKDNFLGDDYWSCIGGFNYTMDEGLPLGLDSIVLILEYAGESVSKAKTANSNFTESAFGRAFPSTVFTKIKIKASEDTQIQLGGAFNVETNDYVMGFSLEHKLWNSLKLKVGCDIFDGEDNTFYGGWAENDRLYTTATYYF